MKHPSKGKSNNSNHSDPPDTVEFKDTAHSDSIPPLRVVESIDPPATMTTATVTTTPHRSEEARIRAEIAALEKEATDKQLAAKQALEKARTVLTEATVVAEQKALKATTSAVFAIAQMIAIADNEMPSQDEDEEEEDREVVAASGIASPPTIVRDSEEIAQVFEPSTQQQEPLASKDPTATIAEDEPPQTTTNTVAETLEVLVAKIEECRQTLLDPNVTIEAQTNAAQLMAQYARATKALKSIL